MMKNPVHPGEIIAEEVLAPLGYSITEAARRLSMSRVLNGRAGVSADLAIRLEQAGVSTARFWLALQSQYDLAKAMERPQPPVERLQDAA